MPARRVPGGVALEFRADEELDSAWLEARPIQYPLQKPRIYTAEGLAEILMIPQANACRTLLRTATLTKRPEWAYEREWRVTSHTRPEDSGHFTDYRFHPNELISACFGPLIPPTDRDAIARLVEQYPIQPPRTLRLGSHVSSCSARPIKRS